jgi:hypothetical protein
MNKSGEAFTKHVSEQQYQSPEEIALPLAPNRWY